MALTKVGNQQRIAEKAQDRLVGVKVALEVHLSDQEHQVGTEAQGLQVETQEELQ